MSINKLEELEKLTELKNKGIITEAEFEFKKFELLNKVNANNILHLYPKVQHHYFLLISLHK